jgi:sugar O-acyltransferase (sialic acid O-acetyltransferase NeuD family)
MQQLLIVGTGGVGRVAAQLVADVNRAAPAWDLVGFLDENPASHGAAVAGLPVLGGLARLADFPGAAVAIAVGQPAARRQIHRRLARYGSPPLATIVHPLAWVPPRVDVGPGALIYPGALIDVDVAIGALAILNKGCTVGHDAVIGDYVSVAPGVNLGGAARIGEGCDLGIGCVTVQGIRVGQWSVVGAGAAVVGDLPANVTAVGVPARVIKERPPGWHER